MRCQIKPAKGQAIYRFGGQTSEDLPFDKFPTDGTLRLAQQYLRYSESIPEIRDRFVVRTVFTILLLPCMMVTSKTPKVSFCTCANLIGFV